MASFKQPSHALYTSGVIQALDPAQLESVPGVRLLLRGGRILVAPRPLIPAAGPTPFDPFPLPVIPGRLLDGVAKVIRVAERRVGCCAAVLLHLEPTTGRWTASVPAPQPALNDPTVAELVAAMRRSDPPLLADRQLGDGRLLAGGYLATPTADAQVVARQVPEVDGLWLFHLAGSWVHAGAFARASDRLYPLPVLDVAGDTDAGGKPHPHDRWWIPGPV